MVSKLAPKGATATIQSTGAAGTSTNNSLNDSLEAIGKKGLTPEEELKLIALERRFRSETGNQSLKDTKGKLEDLLEKSDDYRKTIEERIAERAQQLAEGTSAELCSACRACGNSSCGCGANGPP